MSPTPFESHTVDLILQYISPPSNLQPLPSHLISKSLLQRHHFLEISTGNPKEYLCWPSSVQSEAIDLLESYSINESVSAYQCQYTFDGDFTYAHINLTPAHERGLRPIFQWDTSNESWRFHDLNLMPFPIDARNSPREAADYNPDTNIKTPMISLDPSTSDGDDDAYWDTYGADREPNEAACNLAPAKDPSTEDAYWAQYSSVHGSADSTIPSPLPDSGRKQIHSGEDANPNDPNAPDNEIVSIPVSAFHPARQPSPNALAHLLSSIPPRSPRYRSFTPPTSGTSLVTLPEHGFTPPENDTENGVAKRRWSLDVPKPEPLDLTKSFLRREDSQLPQATSDEADAALKGAVMGLYKLWRSHGSGGEKEQFLRIIQETIESS